MKSRGRLTRRVARAIERQDLPGAERGASSREQPPREGAEPLRRHHESFVARAGGFPPDLFGDSFSPESLRHLPSGLGPLVFWDLETCGLGDVPIFMLGTLTTDPAREDRLDLEILTTTAPEHEGALLEAAAERLGASELWISFNGRCFDHPRLRKRAFRHGVELPDCRVHLDLLLEVRRRWKGRWPDCRLGTVERRLLELERGPGDVPGGEVPARYDDFVATGNWKWLAPVLDHNRRDLVALAVLLVRLCELEPEFLESLSPGR